jgi:23S rRNA (adenine2503-C2)-methyltransferase
MTYDDMCDFFVSIGEKKFRAGQVYRKLYQGISSFDEITELSKSLREKLAGCADTDSVKLLRKQESASDGTRKYLFGIRGGYAIESVFMKYRYGNTACISSQAGCRMGCAFCASGINGLERNLNAGEMVDQVVSMERDTGERISHIVVMGTGEPFDNYDELIRAISIFHDEKGLDIGLRNITVSTCGLKDRIMRFAEDVPQVNLAVSLHAPSDEIRRKLMPVANSCTIEELLSVCKRYTKLTHRRITFEYALIEGVNDSFENAAELASRLKGMLCHVNLIPLNRVSEKEFRGSARKHAQQFVAVLSGKGIEVTVRRELGSDIAAACGQLRQIGNNHN